MQRIALGAVALLWVLAGCGTAQRTARLGALPEPVMATRAAPPPTRALPRPSPRPAPPSPAPQVTPAVPRSWTPPGGVKPGRWQAIVIHHSASRKATPQSMHNYHLKERGWVNGLGYHFVIGNGVNYPDGKVYVGPRWKKQLTGAHCKSGSGRYFGAWRPSNYFNEHAIGICLIGDFEHERPTRRQLEALTRLVEFLCDRYHISADHVYGHGEVTHRTLCPGRYVNMSAVRRSVRRALAQHGRGAAAAATLGQ